MIADRERHRHVDRAGQRIQTFARALVEAASRRGSFRGEERRLCREDDWS
jgi:hypothetical protein